MNDICNPTKAENNFKIFEFYFAYNYSYNATQELGSYRCIATDKETAIKSFEDYKAKNPNKNILSEPTIDEIPIVNGMEIEDF